MSRTQLIAKHSNTPKINHLIILWPKYNFRWYIIQCPTKCFSFITKIEIIITFNQCILTNRNLPVLLCCWLVRCFKALGHDELCCDCVGAGMRRLSVACNKPLHASWSTFFDVTSRIRTSNPAITRDTNCYFICKTGIVQDSFHALWKIEF